MKKTLKIVAVICAVYLLLSLVAGIVLAEASLRLRHRPLTHRDKAEAVVRGEFNADLQDVSIVAADSVVLKAWFVHSQASNGDAVVLTHGITDNREGVAGYAEMFLKHGYDVLLPDARAHGESGGEFATYGLKEADDLHRWVSWLYTHDSPGCVYGFGESYGAALILESLPVEPRYCAVVAEDSFSTAREMSYERVSGFLHLGSWFGKTAGRPIIAAAVFYSRIRYGIDLLQPSPLDAIRHSSVPVLLIHGTADRSISPRHSVILAHSAPDHVQLWLVPNAGHTGAWSVGHAEFETRVVGWMTQHSQLLGLPKSPNSKRQLLTTDNTD